MAERSNSIHIGVDGQWVVNIKLSSSTEVKIIEFQNFTIIEETGNLLPTWQMSFTATPELEKDWVESLKLPIVISKSTNDPEKISSNLHIIRPSVGDYQPGIKKYFASGVLYAPAFTQTPYLTSTKSCNGTDVLQQIAKKHFSSVDTTNMTTSKEEQAWINHNNTDKKFLDYVVSHCYIEDSFVGTGITSSGIYIIVDVVKLSNSTEKYKIGTQQLPLLTTPVATSNSGFMNSVGGYGVQTPIISQDSGTRTLHTPKIKFGFVNNTHPEINNVQRKTLAPVRCSMSNDPKTYMAKANFDTGNALLSMEKVQVTIEAPFFPIKIWDVVNLISEDTSGSGGLNVNHSGKYIVSQVSRTVQNYRFYTSLTLNRDAHNMSTTN